MKNNKNNKKISKFKSLVANFLFHMLGFIDPSELAEVEIYMFKDGTKQQEEILKFKLSYEKTTMTADEWYKIRD